MSNSNRVIVQGVEDIRPHKAGDFWRDTETGEVYLVTKTSQGGFNAHCLEDGGVWDDSVANAEDVFKGEKDFERLPAGTKIEITVT